MDTATTYEVSPNAVAPGADNIDVRDVIARFEALEDVTEPGPDEDGDDWEERKRLEELLDDLRGNGGDEQWRGDWYPLGLVLDSEFEDHARQLAEDCGMIDDDAKWPATCIDWSEAASQLQQDYSCIEYGGHDYWYR